MTVFIDWLRVVQTHADCPVWGSTRRIEFDLETGAVAWEAVRGETVAGSWDTSLYVRSTGSEVSVSGNPSKWGRLDNLVGSSSMAECLALYNAVLRGLGLPLFELRCVVGTIGAFGGERLRVGPLISQLHVTRNLICGAGGDRAFLDWLSAQCYGRLPYKRPFDTTVLAGQVSRRQHELYSKGPEIRAHALKWRRARAPEKLEVKDEAAAYLAQLAQWCEDNGVVRDEVKLGRKWLNESPYRYPENWQKETAETLHRVNSEVATMNAGALSDYGSDVRAKLLAAGVSERQAGLMANAVSAWLSGQVWDVGLGRSQRYSYCKALREHCGLDLRRPSNVRALATCVKPRVLEARELELTDLPDWYRWPQRQEAA